MKSIWWITGVITAKAKVKHGTEGNKKISPVDFDVMELSKTQCDSVIEALSACRMEWAWTHATAEVKSAVPTIQNYLQPTSYLAAIYLAEGKLSDANYHTTMAMQAAEYKRKPSSLHSDVIKKIREAVKKKNTTQQISQSGQALHQITEKPGGRSKVEGISLISRKPPKIGERIGLVFWAGSLTLFFLWSLTDGKLYLGSTNSYLLFPAVALVFGLIIHFTFFAIRSNKK